MQSAAPCGRTPQRRPVQARSERMGQPSPSPSAGQAPQDLAQTREKSQATENKHEDEFGVQPVVDKISQDAPDDDRGHEYDWQLNRHGKLGVGARSLLAGRPRVCLVWIIVQNYC